MGPIALFDKSFLQALSVDESVWFAHFFIPVVCPLFYVETLADLEKALKEGRTPEQEVGIMADKFPDLSGGACIHNSTLVLADLTGHAIPMNGTIPVSGGRNVEVDGRRGVVIDRSPESAAFERWQKRQFLDIERGVARAWRASLASIDLEKVAAQMRKIGVDPKTCRSLNEARALARQLTTSRNHPNAQMLVVLESLSIPRHYCDEIIERWTALGKPPIAELAPYASHVLEVDLFFQFALAAKLISAERPSHRIDVAYLYYLPFCDFFVSWDRFHRQCAPFFLREGQQFVWAEDLKRDLARINEHFAAFSDAEKARGIMSFAHAPPKLENSVVRDLRAKYLGPKYDDTPPIDLTGDAAPKGLVEELSKWTSQHARPATSDGEVEMMAIHRKVRRKKGSWLQVGDDVPDKGD